MQAKREASDRNREVEKMRTRKLSRGVTTIEYSILLAFLVIAGGYYMDRNSISSAVEGSNQRASALLRGEKKIKNSDDFWKALTSDRSPIFWRDAKGEEFVYTGLYEYMTNSRNTLGELNNYTSGAIESGFKHDGLLPEPIKGEVYYNLSEPVQRLLTQDGFTGLDNLTWSVINNKLYVYEGNLNLAEHKDKYFTVKCYDMSAKTSTAQEVRAKFVKSGMKGADYGFLTPG